MELNEQTLEQILIRQREEYQHHLDEVRHDFRQDVDEGLEETRRRMDVLAESSRADIRLVAKGQVGLREEMKVEFAAVRTEAEAIRLELEMIRSELSIIRRDLKEKVGRDELAVLEARVGKLERNIRSK